MSNSKYIPAGKPDIHKTNSLDAVNTLLEAHNEKAEIQKKNGLLRGEKPVKKLCTGAKQTARSLVLLFIKEFRKGKTRFGRMKFTYSYLRKHDNFDYSTRTYARHIIALLEAGILPVKTKRLGTFLKEFKETTKFCIEILMRIDVVLFKDPRHNLNVVNVDNVAKPFATPNKPQTQPKQDNNYFTQMTLDAFRI